MTDKRYGIDDLPVEIELDIPLDTNNAPGVVAAVGWILFVVGFATMVFGPETIHYNRLTGMTFWQFIQAYPGPITSVGVLVLSMSSYLKSSHLKAQTETLLAVIDEKTNIQEEEIPPGKQLDIKIIDYGKLYIQLIDEESASDEISNQTDSNPQS